MVRKRRWGRGGMGWLKERPKERWVRERGREEGRGWLKRWPKERWVRRGREGGRERGRLKFPSKVRRWREGGREGWGRTKFVEKWTLWRVGGRFCSKKKGKIKCKKMKGREGAGSKVGIELLVRF